VRTAPRDALIADSSIESKHGRSFGLNRSLDTVGALVGVSAFGLWSWAYGQNELTARTWVWLSLLCGIPGLLAVALTAWGVEEVARPAAAVSSSPAVKAPLNSTLKRYLIVVALFCLANSSDAFILLRAKEQGFGLPGILGMIALFNLVSAMTALPAAALSDRFGRRTLIAMGWTIYAFAYTLLGSPAARDPLWLAAIIAVYGLFYGFTDGVERAWVADLAPSEARGRAYGIFGLVVGLAALPANAMFGWIWDRYGSETAFLSGAAIAFFATGFLLILVPVEKKGS
jgi:MFS family permease